MGLGSRTVCDADAGGTDASYRRRGKRIEQATNSAGLRSLGLGCCAGGEEKARTHKLGRPGPPWSYPLRPVRGPQARIGLARRRIRVWFPTARPCASLSPQSAQRVRPVRSRHPRCPRSRGHRGDVRVPAQRDVVPPPPAALGSATAAWRREAARMVREKFVGPEPSAPPPPLKPALLKQAGNEA